MKYSAIREMFNGNIGRQEPTKECCKLLRESIKLDEELKSKLSPEVWDIYEKAVDATEAVHLEELETIYEEGFSFGLLIGVNACEIIK